MTASALMLHSLGLCALGVCSLWPRCCAVLRSCWACTSLALPDSARPQVMLLAWACQQWLVAALAAGGQKRARCAPPALAGQPAQLRRSQHRGGCALQGGSHPSPGLGRAPWAVPAWVPVQHVHALCQGHEGSEP